LRIRPEPPRSWTWPHYIFAQEIVRAGLEVNGGWEVTGVENVPVEGGAIVAANHLSFLDPPALGAALPRRTYFFAKAELFVPIFGFLIRKCYAFPVERGGADMGATREAIRLLRGGEFMVMFPEGTRSLDGELQELNLGAVLLASRAGVPVLPAAIQGTDAVFPIGAKCIFPGSVRVSFGPPIDTGQFGPKPRKEELAKMNDQLRKTILALQADQRKMEG